MPPELLDVDVNVTTNTLARMSALEAVVAEIQRDAVSVPTIERRGNLSYREFVYEYQTKRRPVILTNATSGWAARKWTPQSLATRLGNRELTFRDGARPYAFKELVDLIVASNEKSPAPYARNINVARDLPELLPDISPRLEFATPDWKSTRLLPKNWLFPNHLEEMFFGGAGARFPSLHVDYYGMDGFINQLYGKKDFLIFAPCDGRFLYPREDNPLVSTIDNFDQPDYARFPLLKQATPIRFTLQPGETFYQPNGWWHTTTMREVSITVITQTWHSGNWPLLIREYNRSAQKNGSKRWKTKLATTYLQAIGYALATRDALLHR